MSDKGSFPFEQAAEKLVLLSITQSRVRVYFAWASSTLTRRRTVRGGDIQQGGMWSYIQPEQRVPQDHPMRRIRAMVDQALTTPPPS
jgi:hypothetical protein